MKKNKITIPLVYKKIFLAAMANDIKPKGGKKNGKNKPEKRDSKKRKR